MNQGFRFGTIVALVKLKGKCNNRALIHVDLNGKMLERDIIRMYRGSGVSKFGKSFYIFYHSALKGTTCFFGAVVRHKWESVKMGKCQN